MVITLSQIDNQLVIVTLFSFVSPIFTILSRTIPEPSQLSSGIKIKTA